MPTLRKRKGSPSLEEDAESSKRRFAETTAEQETTEDAAPESDEQTPAVPEQSDEKSASKAPASSSNDRAARFAALKARNQASRKSNLAETKNEARRDATDPSQLTSLTRKKDIAEHKLLKAETEEAGEDFERKRAWDWTIEESERWDERLARKQAARDDVAFKDYGREAGKVYGRQINELEKTGQEERMAAYEKEKREAIERSVRSGGLEIVETPDGELIAVDKDGSFLSTTDGSSAIAQAGQKPDREAVDRLVADIKKAEEVRMKKRRDRGRQDEDGQDITYINEKNKQFNMKLARFYNKYTADIRESFERGTAI